MKNKLMIVLILLIVAGGGTYFAVHAQKDVETFKVQAGDIATEIEETGYVRTESLPLEIQTQITGKIAQVNKKVGDKVVAGEAIFMLENLDITNDSPDNIAMERLNIENQILTINQQIDQKKSEYDIEEVNLKTMDTDLVEFKKEFDKKLKQYGSLEISKTEYDKAVNDKKKQEDAIESQQLKLKRINSYIRELEGQKELLSNQKTVIDNKQKTNDKKVNQLTIISPVDGEILTFPAQIGQIVNPGVVLATVGNTSSMVIKVDVLSDDMRDIKLGQEVLIKGDILKNNLIKGKIKEIYPEAIEKVSDLGIKQRRVTVIVAFEKNELLKSGYEVEVVFQTDKRSNVLIIPRESLRRPDDSNENQVYAIVDGKVALKHIKTGIKSKDFIEITDGLSKGEQIIKDGTSKMSLGTKVREMK